MIMPPRGLARVSASGGFKASEPPSSRAQGGVGGTGDNISKEGEEDSLDTTGLPGGGSSRRANTTTTASSSSSSSSDSVLYYGVPLVLKGLPALAQAQCLSLDFYSSSNNSASGSGGAGENNVASSSSAAAAAAVHLSGGVNNSEGLFITLRRALQQIGASLLILEGRAVVGASQTGAGSSVLASGVFSRDTPQSLPGSYPHPIIKLSPAVNLDTEVGHYGLPERCVAVESLDFLLDALLRVRTRMEGLLPPAQGTSCMNFFTRAALCVVQLRGLQYHSSIVRTLPECGALPGMITSIAWFVVLYTRTHARTHARA